MAQLAKVLTVNIAAIVHEGAWTGSEGRTGIDKQPTASKVKFENDGVAGDVVEIGRAHV